ncbi:MAG TPA: hypothetical protein VJ553_03635 [Candidatus Paceibacterota bacterium]|nr:hypothetical protein [Candidatus Paceibacterota bacterium]
MLHDTYNRLGRILRTDPRVLLSMEERMNIVTGQEGVLEDVLRQNDIIVERTLASLGLTRRDPAKVLHTALIQRMMHFDEHLNDLLGRPDLSRMSDGWNDFKRVASQVYVPPKGLFIKYERAQELLGKYPPKNLIEHFGYRSTAELLEKEGTPAVLAALRFTQSTEWMHQFFDVSYCGLVPDDFEERDVEFLLLDPKWLELSGKFKSQKLHNVSHLKEFGIIFVIPQSLETPGVTLRLMTLVLHYLHEVPFYAALFRRHMEGPDFAKRFQSLLRGDVSADALPDSGKASWRIIQRYLAKDNPDDSRLFEPHVSPEAEHWWRAEEDLERLSRILGHEQGYMELGWWVGLDFVGDFFPDPEEKDGKQLVSFDLVDLIMTLVWRDQGRQFLYHQQEALWNKIFTEYMGRERMNQLIEEHIFDGFIILE